MSLYSLFSLEEKGILISYQSRSAVHLSVRLSVLANRHLLATLNFRKLVLKIIYGINKGAKTLKMRFISLKLKATCWVLFALLATILTLKIHNKNILVL